MQAVVQRAPLLGAAKRRVHSIWFTMSMNLRTIVSQSLILGHSWPWTVTPESEFWAGACLSWYHWNLPRFSVSILFPVGKAFLEDNLVTL